MIWIWCLGGPESGQRTWCLWWERGAATKRKLLDLARWIVRDEGEREGAPFPPPPRLLVGGRENGRGYGYGTLVAPKRGAATTRNRWIWCGVD